MSRCSRPSARPGSHGGASASGIEEAISVSVSKRPARRTAGPALARNASATPSACNKGSEVADRNSPQTLRRGNALFSTIGDPPAGAREQQRRGRAGGTGAEYQGIMNGVRPCRATKQWLKGQAASSTNCQSRPAAASIAKVRCLQSRPGRWRRHRAGVTRLQPIAHRRWLITKGKRARRGSRAMKQSGCPAQSARTVATDLRVQSDARKDWRSRCRAVRCRDFEIGRRHRR